MKGFNNIYYGKTVLITGHTGFKGSWLAIWLHELGAKVVGYALDSHNDNDNFVLSKLSEKIVDIKGDIRDSKKINEVFEIYQPTFVFHLAAQSIVRSSYANPRETFEINFMGTVNVLDAIRNCKSTKVGIMVTTDKCYENIEQIYGYRENDRLGGYDPYSASKASAELAINSFRLSYMNKDNPENYGKAIASVRAGNVIGGGDWSTDRIVPDCIKSLEKNVPILIRNAKAIRPWQHVLDPLYGYLLLGEKLYNNPTKYSEAWNFGPDFNSMISVWNLASKIKENYGSGSLQNISSESTLHESKFLFLDISKARFKLGWQPVLNIDDAVALIVDWYKNYKNSDVYQLCKNQIESFMTRIK